MLPLAPCNLPPRPGLAKPISVAARVLRPIVRAFGLEHDAGEIADDA
jgi:hypothetical protein